MVRRGTWISQLDLSVFSFQFLNDSYMAEVFLI